MSIKFETFIQNRNKIFVVLCATVFISFIVSFALSNISIWSILAFFFIDSKESISRKFNEIKQNRIVHLYLLFFVIQVLGMIHTQNIIFGIKKTIALLPVVFLPAILTVEKIKQSNYKKLLCFLKYAILLIFIVLVFIHVCIDFRDLNTFVHFTIEKKLGVSQFYLAFILFVPFLESLKQVILKKKKALNYLSLILSVILLMLLGNKTVFIFLVIIGIVFLYFHGKKGKKIAFVTVFSFIGFLILAFQTPILKSKIEILLNTTDFDIETIITKNRFTLTKNTFEHRVLINYLSIKEGVKELPFGVGTGDYRDFLYDLYKKTNFKAGLESNLNNHNQYMTEFLKTGLFGSTCLIYLIFLLIKKVNKEHFFYSYLIVFFMLGCMVESYLDRQHGIVIFSFIIPFFLSHDTNKKLKPIYE